jgi:N-acetylmuramoyl-L-alanine amidase
MSRCKVAVMLLVFSIILILFQAAAYAETTSRATVMVNDQPVLVNEQVFIDGSRIFVPVRMIIEALQAEMIWQQESKQILIRTQAKDEILFTLGQKTVTLNGHDFLMDVEPFVHNGQMYLPLRHVAEFLHTQVQWDANERTAFLQSVPLYVPDDELTVAELSRELDIDLELLMLRNNIQSADQVLDESQELKIVIPETMEEKIDEEDLELLARIIYLEAGYEPFEGQVAVGNVVLNRVESSLFPNTIREVIYHPGQFSPVRTGEFDRAVPSDTAYRAALEALSGTSYAGDALYFFNPRVTRHSFFLSKEVVAEIGNHRFIK